MKILHLGNLKSGIDTYVRHIVAFAGDDFDFVVVNGADDASQPYLRHGQPVKQYTIDMYRPLNPWRDLKSLWQTIRIICKEKPDIVHCHSAKGGVIGRVAAFLTGTTCVFTPNAFSFLSAESDMKKTCFIWLEKITKLNAVLLGCSESEKQLGMEVVGYSDKKAFAWNNAIPKITPHDVKEPEPSIRSERYIISIGRPSYQKNPLLMVEAMSLVHQQYPHVKLYLLGAGFHSPMLQETSAHISRLGLDETIVLLPWISHAETLGYLKYAQLYFTTARYEGLPLAVLEAMAMGKPIVSSDVLGNRECVNQGENGLLLPMDASKMAEAIGRILDDDERRENMGQASLTLFEQQFMIENRIGDIESFYRERIA